MPAFDLDAAVFYVDEDLDSDQFVVPVREAGLRIVRHRDVLPKGTSDLKWIRFVARRRWFALSHDYRISKVAKEQRAVMHEGLGLFVLRGKSEFEAHRRLAEKVLGARVPIAGFIQKNPRPFIAAVVGPQGKGRRFRCHGRRPPDRAWNEGKMEARRQLREPPEWPPRSGEP